MASDVPHESVRVRRAEERADYDPASVNAILDEGMVAHVGTVRDGAPVVIPMYYVRDGARLLVHGAPASGVVRRSGESTPVCVTVTLLDGLVLARSSFHHSMNYRSVVVIGEAVEIRDPADKDRALDLFVERMLPGRGPTLRPTTTKELRATSVLEIPLEYASAKVRTGPPVDDEPDYALDIWAGVVPMSTIYGAPEADPRLGDDVALPANVADLTTPA